MRDRLEALAPAGVGLATFVVLADVRMDDAWSSGALLAVAAAAAVVLLAAGLAAPRSGGGAGPGATALLVAGLVCTGVALQRLGESADGQDFSNHGATLTLVLGAGTVIAAFCAARGRSSACLLIAAVVAVGTLMAAWDWLFGLDDRDAAHALVTVSFAVLLLAGMAAPGRAGVALVSAAGVTVLAGSYALGLSFGEGGGEPWGWELVTLVQGLTLAGYAAVNRERGPGYLAFFVLLAFAMTAGAVESSSGIDDNGVIDVGASLVGWPLAVAAATILAAAYALRPRRAQ
jgi:hypothetical protein